MFTIDNLAVSESGKRLINIRDASRNYNTAFWLEDGKKLTVTHSDGFQQTVKCKYIEPYHFYFGATCYHIDQFADLVSRNNLRVEPEEYVTDLNLYAKKYMDRSLKDSNGKIIPYRNLVTIEDNRQPMKMVAICPQTTIDRHVAFWNGAVKPPETTFYSIAQAKEQLLPKLDLTAHEQKVLTAVFDEIEREIPRISQKEFDEIPSDYKGVYSNFDGRHPEWAGKRCAFLPGHGTTLFIEDVSFIIDSGSKPSLASRLNAAAVKSDAAQKFTQRSETNLAR